ncbi:pimeloyl-ACP methyl ester carboxylesterase [Kineothrix alysoides]|uniref:Pimeloyl-ACP methyl ester carboxylesterase n=1 Tax=Kineothrix alysoides TaxID=1469948 RepID=A0A4R1R0X0_9FIRM|nr:alpha/beta hydrolase [Kineothrix alysoides]TCL58941.1 pimeloyl-ACP methyl ester carboxylesterase [Kineothrix alysoides]
MIKFLIFISLLLISVISLFVLFINIIKFIARFIKKEERNPHTSRIKKNMLILTTAIALCAGFALLTQFTASTPSIHNEKGNKMEGSISELRQVTLNGRKEWISIRSENRENPVLLFLAGGPGGSQMAAVRYDLGELEKHFVVVNWDQAGSGKSYGAADIGSLTVNTYIEDGYALTKYLCETFKQDKIYLVGESWGSALGIFLIDRAPELFHAFIGTGQMISFLETEVTDYRLALEIAREKDDTKTVNTLKANGQPPYYGRDVTWKSATYLQYLSTYMAANPDIHNGGYNTLRDLFSSEYGILDKINYFRGIVSTFNSVYPQLYNVDLRKNYKEIDVPVYFFLGRHDINAPTSFVEDYFELLHAPSKEIVWFEHSGHSPWINESERFVSELLRVTYVR